MHRQDLPWVDGLKAGGCLIIVLHHLCFYGPMTDVAAEAWPDLSAWLMRHGRLAVQVFLVLGGFLATRSLMRGQAAGRTSHVGAPPLTRRIADRYLRLAVPMWVMLALAVLVNGIVGVWMPHDSVSAPPEWWHVLAHVLFLQDLLDAPAISAGVWYAAIDLQLAVILWCVWSLSHRVPRWLHAGGRDGDVFGLTVLAFMAASAWGFNRDADWDVAAPYFWCSYGLGVLAAWCSFDALAPRKVGLFWMGAAGVVLSALWIQPRPTLAVAAATAALLWHLGRRGRLQGRSAPVVRELAACSYSVFLLHFPVCLLVNAAWMTLLPQTPGVQTVGVAAALGLSVWAGRIFHQEVEIRLTDWVKRRVFSENAVSWPAQLLAYPRVP